MPDELINWAGFDAHGDYDMVLNIHLKSRRQVIPSYKYEEAESQSSSR